MIQAKSWPAVQIVSVTSCCLLKLVACNIRLTFYGRVQLTVHTSQDSFYKWTKISSLEIDIFGLKMMVKSGLDFFCSEIHPAPSEIPANLPGQFGHCGQIFLHWAAATLKGLGEFQNKKSRPLFTIIFKKKMVISRLKILVHL